MVSTRALHLVPDIDSLKRACRAFAALDAVLSPPVDFRYFHYQHHWAEGRELASMRDDSGDEWFLLFNSAGAILKGFVPDSDMAEPYHRAGETWPGVLDEVPACFHELFNDPRFAAPRATFCVWRQNRDRDWHHGPVQYPTGPDPDGSEHLMAIFDCDPVTYARWAEQYYEIEIPFIEVRRVYLHRPMTEEMAKALNPQIDWNLLIRDLEQIGYPVSPERKA